MVPFFLRVLGFGVPVAAAAALLVYGLQTQTGPQQRPPAEASRTVRVSTVEKSQFVPRVTGYGTVEPVRTWDAVAQVPGRIEYLNPALRTGAILKSGTEIIRISPQDYQLAVDEAKANVRSAEARLDELQVQAENARRSLELERRSLELKEADFERQRRLLERGTVSQSVVDTTEREVLTQRSRVQDIENTLRLSPVQIEAQRRQIEVARSRLETAQLNLDRTAITLPFDARIAQVAVEKTQFVSTGTTMAVADDISAAEVPAQIPQGQFRSFVMVSVPRDLELPQLVDQDAIRAAIERLGWSAKVRLRFDDQNVVWDGEVLRTTDTIDPNTRSVAVVVAVDDPYADARPGLKPPLVKGMFVQVELIGQPIENQIVIPRSAVHGGQVFTADDQNRLRIKDVKVRLMQGEQALIESGLSPGERLVLSDITPAIEGMLLRPVPAGDPGQDDEDPGSGESAVGRTGALQ